jgi:hypothetical protein
MVNDVRNDIPIAYMYGTCRIKIKKPANAMSHKSAKNPIPKKLKKRLKST